MSLNESSLTDISMSQAREDFSFSIFLLRPACTARQVNAEGKGCLKPCPKNLNGIRF